jgi:hypothetical protein
MLHADYTEELAPAASSGNTPASITMAVSR